MTGRQLSITAIVLVSIRFPAGLGSRVEPGGDQQGAELIAIQGDSM